jgi:hypothetical protein
MFIIATKSKKVIMKDYDNGQSEDKMIYSYKDFIEPDLMVFKATIIEKSLTYIICMARRKCVVVNIGFEEKYNSIRIINIGYDIIWDFFLVYN